MSKKSGARGLKDVDGRAETREQSAGAAAAAHDTTGGGLTDGVGGGAAAARASAWSVDAGLPVSRYMSTEVAYLRDNMWVDAAVTFLEARGLHEAPVLDGEGRPVGMLYVDDVETEFALSDGGASFEDNPDPQAALLADDRVAEAFLRRNGFGSGFHLDGGPRVRVSEVMVPYVPEIAAETSIVAAAMLMRDNQLGHVMVVGDDGRAVGVFARDDLVEWLVQETARRPLPAAGRGVCLRDVMRPVISIRRRATLTTARDLMATHGLAELPVVEIGRAVGVVTEAEIIAMLSAHRDDDGWMQELLVEDVMGAPVLLGAPGDAISGLRLTEAHGGCVLVAEHGRLIGIVTERDLSPALVQGDRAPGDQLSY